MGQEFKSARVVNENGPGANMPIAGVTIPNAERIAGAGFDRGTNLYFTHSVGEFGDEIDLLRTNKGFLRAVTIDCHTSSVTITSGAGEAEGFIMTSKPVANAVRQAFLRAFNDGTINAREAEQLEKLRQEVTVASPRGFNDAEIQRIVTRAARIAPNEKLADLQLGHAH